MKTTSALVLFLLAGILAFARQSAAQLPACDCPDCREKAVAGAADGYTLPELQALNDGQVENLPQAAEKVLPGDHDDHDHSEEEDHDHDAHDHVEHESAGTAEILHVVAEETGIQVYEAESGAISKTAVFPAEIKLNRDRMAVVSARYASVVREVFAEIGDEVKKGDVLASLENRETLSVYTVVAPLDGVVIAKDVAMGETADADKMLYQVADLSSVWADISIFPQYQHLVKKGMRVQFVAHDGHAARGTVQYISPIVSHETRTFTARCILKEAREDFTPGSFVRALIRTQSVKAEVRVERSAVQTIDGETVVFVPGAHGYEPVAVVTGLGDDHFVEIRQGLEPGDPYVAAGAFMLKAELVTSGMDAHAGHNH